MRNLDAAPEAHQNDRSSVRELSGLTFDSLRKNLAWWAVTRRTSKNHKTVKIGGWALARDNTVLVSAFRDRKPHPSQMRLARTESC